VKYKCVPDTKAVMGEFHTIVNWNPPQGSEKGGKRVNMTGKRAKYVNINIRDESLILRDLRHSFSLLW